jgi:hypothetical protein
VSYSVTEPPHKYERGAAVITMTTRSQWEGGVLPGSRSERCCGLGRSARNHALGM